MRLPVQITWRDMAPSKAVGTKISEEAAKLEEFYDRITSCRVMVENRRRHQNGKYQFHIRINLTVPGAEIVLMNLNAVDQALERLQEVRVPERVDSEFDLTSPVPAAAPSFVRDVLGEIIAGRGNELPVSALPCDGTYPTGTARWEKRNLALEIPA